MAMSPPEGQWAPTTCVYRTLHRPANGLRLLIAARVWQKNRCLFLNFTSCIVWIEEIRSDIIWLSSLNTKQLNTPNRICAVNTRTKYTRTLFSSYSHPLLLWGGPLGELTKDHCAKSDNPSHNRHNHYFAVSEGLYFWWEFRWSIRSMRSINPYAGNVDAFLRLLHS